MRIIFWFTCTLVAFTHLYCYPPTHSPPASLHPQYTRRLWLHQPPRGEHCVRVCGDTACPAPALESGVASGAQPLPGGGATCHQRRCHLWTGTQLRGQLSGRLPALWVVALVLSSSVMFKKVSLLFVSSLYVIHSPSSHVFVNLFILNLYVLIPGKDSKTEVAPTSPVALVPEEKVSFSLYALSVSTLTVAKIRKVYNKLDSKAIAKQVRHLFISGLLSDIL